MSVDPLPCPFCGDTNISVIHGSTYRWRFAECNTCGGAAGEVRIRTTGPGTKEDWEAKAADDAIKEWNNRVPADKSQS